MCWSGTPECCGWWRYRGIPYIPQTLNPECLIRYCETRIKTFSVVMAWNIISIAWNINPEPYTLNPGPEAPNCLDVKNDEAKT